MATPDETLSHPHRAWLAENLLRGVPAEKARETLVAAGVPDALAAAAIRETLASPVFEGARRLLREGRRHMQIVGLRRAVATEAEPRLAVDVRTDLEPEAFYAHYYGPGRPLKLEGFARDWPAVRTWSPQFFADRFGDVEIEYVAGRNAVPDYDRATPSLSRRAPLRDYIAQVLEAGESNDLYFVANNHNLERPAFEPLWADLRYPAGILDPKRRQKTASLWIGPAGTVTPLHHDTCSVFFVQICGRKRFRMAPPTETRLLERATAMYADVDPEDPAGPAADLDFAVVDVGPGDVLFIPVGWWHHVRALDVSVSVAMAGFTRPNWFDWYRPGSVAP
ncbi:cupin-like domain-containing protein [Myxococcota bacterium]|nr:cupin-like domain-containing protein [Myxococcota bacterium]